jgi:hypothetical protein
MAEKKVRTGTKTWENETISRYLWVQKQMQLHGYDYLTIQMLSK